MSNKLQELTDRLYNEGLSRGREEGELLLANARKEADEILAAARREAESIVKDARENADKLRSKAESDIRMASEQSLQATRKDIEDLLLNSVCADKISAALKDEDLIKEMNSALDIAVGLDIKLFGFKANFKRTTKSQTHLSMSIRVQF